jgi:hypothetical protein
VRLTKVRGDCTDGDTCPAKFVTDRGTVVFVGREMTDPAERAQMGIGPGETAVEVPVEIGGTDA